MIKSGRDQRRRRKDWDTCKEKQLLATRGQMPAWLYVTMTSFASLVEILLTLIKFKERTKYLWKRW